MEYCIEARALKPSLRREIDVRPNQSQAVAAVDEFVYETEVHGGGFVEDFLIDDLLDFPEKEVEDGDEEEKDSLSDCSAELETDENGYSTVTGDFLSLPDDAGGLAVPQDDLADLEWVSRFVDDTMPEFPPLYPTKSGVSCRKPCVSGSLPVQLNQHIHIKPLIIPAKPRTKRQRIGRVWSLNSSTASESSTTTSSSLSSPSSIISSPVQFGFSRPLAKKQKTKPDPAQPADPTGRRCSHCQVQKTPQWRAGPEGAKTLCNACGVRFKSGRLYPEYRPACSPTFRGDVHSNSHRKVLEMRKKKEAAAAGSGLLAVQSC